MTRLIVSYGRSANRNRMTIAKFVVRTKKGKNPNSKGANNERQTDHRDRSRTAESVQVRGNAETDSAARTAGGSMLRGSTGECRRVGHGCGGSPRWIDPAGLGGSHGGRP